MKILSIEAGKTDLTFVLDAGSGELLLYERVGTAGSKHGRTLSVSRVPLAGGRAVLPRFAGAHDRLYSEWTAYAGSEKLDGVRFVTDIADDVPENAEPYPELPGIKCLCRPWLPMARTELGACQTQFDVNIPSLMTTLPSDNTIAYEWDGGTYYFVKDRIESVDAFLLSEPEVVFTAVMVNAANRRGGTEPQDPELVGSCTHPGFDWDCPTAFISAFDMRTEEGLRCFGAFSDFLAQRYSRPDRKYGRIAGYVVSNEVTSQYVWGNAGEMDIGGYCAEYLRAMRMVWLAAAHHWKAARVYASFDHFWNRLTYDLTLPKRFYSGKQMLDLFLWDSLRDGNFPWHLAHHPYPENLNYPDFWNDRTADFSFETPRVTYKNMEVLEAYLGQPEFLYRGAPRRIIFSEQSLNSRSGPLAAVTEKQAAAGYMLSYLKARQMITVDMMMHRLIDDPGEFGLNLGIYRYDPSRPDGMGEAKPICACVKAADTPAEAEFANRAREYIGREIYDYLLSPPAVERTDSSREFQIVTH